jgi:hypothetical protein
MMFKVLAIVQAENDHPLVNNNVGIALIGSTAAL